MLKPEAPKPRQERTGDDQEVQPRALDFSGSGGLWKEAT